MEFNRKLWTLVMLVVLLGFDNRGLVNGEKGCPICVGKVTSGTCSEKSATMPCNTAKDMEAATSAAAEQLVSALLSRRSGDEPEDKTDEPPAPAGGAEFDCFKLVGNVEFKGNEIPGDLVAHICHRKDFKTGKIEDFAPINWSQIEGFRSVNFKGEVTPTQKQEVGAEQQQEQDGGGGGPQEPTHKPMSATTPKHSNATAAESGGNPINVGNSSLIFSIILALGAMASVLHF